MQLSFYSSAVNASAQQEKLDVIANNIANANTSGFKTQTANFSELLYRGIRNQNVEGQEKMKIGLGTKVDTVYTSYSQGPLQQTDNLLDFAIEGDGFFAVRDPQTNEVSYTRAGEFQLSLNTNGTFNLVTTSGKLVMSRDMQPIVVTSVSEQNFDNIGIFDFANKEGMLSVGDTEFMPVAKNGAAILQADQTALQGKIEGTNMEMSVEFTRLIEAQRSYGMNLKMLQTSDEVIQTINSLR